MSIDVHNVAEKNDALNIINAYKGQIYFTVYIYSRDTHWLPELKAAGALVGFHVNPIDIGNSDFGPVVDQINKYFGTYRWAQPVSIHGRATTRLQPNEMSLLASFNVPFVRAAGNTGSSGGNPPVKLAYSTCHSSSSIISGAEHYFFHTLSSNDGCKTRVDTTLTELGFTK